MEKVNRNCASSKEVEETQSGSASYPNRLAAGGSTTCAAEEGRAVAAKEQKKQEFKKKQDSGPGSMQTEQISDLSSYNYSCNSEAPAIPARRSRFSTKMLAKPGHWKCGESQTSKHPAILPEFGNTAAPEQLCVKRHLNEVWKIVRNVNEFDNLVAPLAAAHLSAKSDEAGPQQRQKGGRHVRLKDEPVVPKNRQKTEAARYH
ncbi:unnamed protein product [Gongylonema pulchrum]|uniref:Uncharacterized protein n=1 Tax=Gongylonema pulchrum TaxID=637853 RepID=A0A3P6RDY1_9BILA|nr:unnamed protein product [Gongylonema pulchrum]